MAKSEWRVLEYQTCDIEEGMWVAHFTMISARVPFTVTGMLFCSDRPGHKSAAYYSH